MARFAKLKRKFKGKSGAGKQATSAKKGSALKKINKRTTRSKMLANKNKKKKSSSAQKQQGKPEKAQKQSKPQKQQKQQAQQSKPEKAKKQQSKPEKAQKKATGQDDASRRQRRDAAETRMREQEKAHFDRMERYNKAQRRELKRYRRRKRAIDYSDRQRGGSTTTTTTVVSSPQSSAVAYGAPQYGMMAYPQYGTMPPQGMPLQYGAPLVPSELPPPQGGAPPYGPPPVEQPGFGAASEEGRAETPVYYGDAASEVPTRRSIRGVPEPEIEVELKDIPALRELDQNALRAFLVAREKFERATTIEDKIRYSTEFFALTDKLDKLFHQYTKVWHTTMKYRPRRATIAQANEYTDSLSKEEIVALSKMSKKELGDYLASVM